MLDKNEFLNLNVWFSHYYQIEQNTVDNAKHLGVRVWQDF